MSTVTLRIQVDRTGASENIRQVKDDLQGMGAAGQQGGQQAASGMSALQGAISGARAAVTAFVAAYATIQTLSGVVRMADEYTRLQGQLRLVTDSTEEFNAAQSGVFAIAQQAGQALGGVNAIYASIARSTDELNLSQSQMLTITQAVSQSMAVSNTSAAAASGAITQLGQAFASGVLRGDEFNSVNEAAPRIMDALSASLGVTKGELRAMAEAGQLTSDVLAQGLLSQAPQIAAEFETMGGTVSQAFTRLSNAVLQFVGEANEASGAGAALAAVITGIANALPAFAFGLTAVAAGYAAVSAAALVANPAIGFTATLLAGAATAMGVLIAAYAGYKLGEYLVNEVALVQAAVRSLYVGMNDLWTAIKVGALQAFTAVQVAWITVVDSIQDRLADLILAFIDLSEIQLPFGLRADFAYGQAEAFRELAFRLRDATDATTQIDNATGFLSSEVRDSRAAAEAYAASMFDAVEEMERATGATNEVRAATTAVRPPIEAAAAATRTLATASGTAATAAGVLRNALAQSRTGLADFARTALQDVVPAMEGATTAVDQFGEGTRRSGEQAGEWAGYWESASGDVLDSFIDLFANGLDGLESFGDEMQRRSRQIASDIIKEFARTGEISIPAGMYGQGGTGASIGGWMGAIGSAYGGYQNAQQGGSAGGTILGFAAAGAQIGGPWGAAIGAVVGALVSAFVGQTDPLLRVRSDEFSGPRRSEGQAVSALGNIFIRTEDLGDNAPTSPEIAQRLAEFDNLIAGLLGPEQLESVRAALENVNDTFRNGAATIGEALESRFGTIVGALDDNIQRFVGSAGTLEDRLFRLADALAITAIAGIDNGISSDFDTIGDLLLRFRTAGETLYDTFGRLVQGISLVDTSLLMLGGTFAGTRLEAAVFAGELIELAGGMDQFSQVLNGALEALFSEAERNQFAADQSQAALNAALTGLNISGAGVESIRQQLRDQLRAAMEAGNAELTNQILQAANLLGVFSSAIEALGEDAVAAAAGIALGGRSLTSGGTLGSGAGTGLGQTPTAPTTQLEASQATVRALDRHTSLLERIATNTDPRAADPTAAKSAKDGSDAARQTATTLARIEVLIAQAVQAQVQAELKRLSGVNAAGVKRRTTA